jgi:hypothetical protein
MKSTNRLLLEVAEGVAAIGADLTYSEYRFGNGDIGALKICARARLERAGANPDDRTVRIAAQLALDAMSAQYEIDVRNSARQIEEQSPAQGMMAGDTDDLEVKGQLLPKS